MINKRQAAEPARRKVVERPPGRLPDMSIFFVLMSLLALILGLGLVLLYWPGSSAATPVQDIDAYREPILWALGAVLAASLFAGLAQILYELRRLVEATNRARIERER